MEVRILNGTADEVRMSVETLEVGRAVTGSDIGRQLAGTSDLLVAKNMREIKGGREMTEARHSGSECNVKRSAVGGHGAVLMVKRFGSGGRSWVGLPLYVMIRSVRARVTPT